MDQTERPMSMPHKKGRRSIKLRFWTMDSNTLRVLSKKRSVLIYKEIKELEPQADLGAVPLSF